jgi:hypothetical protein
MYICFIASASSSGVIRFRSVTDLSLSNASLGIDTRRVRRIKIARRTASEARDEGGSDRWIFEKLAIVVGDTSQASGYWAPTPWWMSETLLGKERS